MADLQQSLNEAHCTILDGSAALQTLTSKSDGICLPWADTTDADLPALMYQPVTLTLVQGGIPRVWLAQFQLDAFAVGNGAAKKANDMIEAALTALTHNAFKALGLDLGVSDTTRQAWPPQDQKTKSSSRLTARATVTITYRISASA